MPIAFASVVLAALAAFPHAEAESTDNVHVVFPDALRGRPAVVAIAVDRASADTTKAWALRLLPAVGDRAALYSVAVVEGVPFFAKGFVRDAFRKGAPVPPPGDHSHLLVTFDGHGWTSLVQSGAKDVPEIVVVDATGAVVYAARTRPTDDAVAAVERAVASASATAR